MGLSGFGCSLFLFIVSHQDFWAIFSFLLYGRFSMFVVYFWIILPSMGQTSRNRLHVLGVATQKYTIYHCKSPSDRNASANFVFKKVARAGVGGKLYFGKENAPMCFFLHSYVDWFLIICPRDGWLLQCKSLLSDYKLRPPNPTLHQLTQ